MQSGQLGLGRCRKFAAASWPTAAPRQPCYPIALSLCCHPALTAPVPPRASPSLPPSLFPSLPLAFNRWASYQILQPRWVHVPYLRAVHMVTCKMLGEYFDAIQPDLVVSARHSQCVGRLQGNTWKV